jgi:mRNA interferase RelE/StbE
MVSHEIRFSKESVKTLDSLEAKPALRIAEAIKKLATTPKPPGCRKMVGSEKDYRIRVGDYRVIYQIRSTVLMIFVIRIGHRKDIYH